jgi:nucleoside-diphosphate-sugar epimerase
MNKILITGAQGFLGSALKRRCISAGLPVLELGTAHGDITDNNIFSAYESEDISHVFHLAAKTFVPASWVHPSVFYQTNTMGTENVLEFCRRKGLSLTYVSAYLYGPPKRLPIAEDHPIAPNNPYAHSKYLAEQLCEFYARHYKIKVTVIRPFNIYGAGQNIKFLIPHIIHQALHGDVIKIKDLHPKRDYVYIDDVVEALMLTQQPSAALSTYNIGAGNSLSVKEIIDIIQEILQTRKPVEAEEVVRQNELPDVVADITKARQGLHWTPKHSFREGMAKLIQHEKGSHSR